MLLGVSAFAEAIEAPPLSPCGTSWDDDWLLVGVGEWPVLLDNKVEELCVELEPLLDDEAPAAEDCCVEATLLFAVLLCSGGEEAG